MCKNCQKFGHPTRACRADAQCAKCSGCHSTVDCTVNLREDFRCPNCGGRGHAAHYGGCKVKNTHNKATRVASSERISYAEALNGRKAPKSEINPLHKAPPPASNTSQTPPQNSRNEKATINTVHEDNDTTSTQQSVSKHHTHQQNNARSEQS